MDGILTPALPILRVDPTPRYLFLRRGTFFFAAVPPPRKGIPWLRKLPRSHSAEQRQIFHARPHRFGQQCQTAGRTTASTWAKKPRYRVSRPPSAFCLCHLRFARPATPRSWLLDCRPPPATAPSVMLANHPEYLRTKRGLLSSQSFTSHRDQPSGATNRRRYQLVGSRHGSLGSRVYFQE